MPHKLLLADDSVTIQRVIELTFADEDVHVTAVGNGQEAIDRMQRDRPDIVLADVGMPERNGYEVAAFMKSTPALARIPVVLLTGAFEPIDEARARSVGCDGVLVKPFEPHIVISRVKDLLAGKHPSGMWGSGPVAQGPVRQTSHDFDSRSAPTPAAPATPAVHGDSLEAYFDHLDAAFASASADAPGPPGLAAPPDALQRREPIPISRRPAASGPAAGKDSFAGWDPDLHGDPARPAPADALVFPPRPAAEMRDAAAAPPPLAPPLPPPVAAQRPPVPAAAVPSVPAAPPAAAAVAPAPQKPAAPAPAPTSLVDAFAALLAAEQRIALTPSAATTAAPVPPTPGPIDEATLETVTVRVLARLSDQARPTILDVAERLVREEIERIKQSS